MTLKSQISQWEIVANSLSTKTKSLTTARKRYSQGLPFFTKTLPGLGKDLEAGLTGTFSLSADTLFSARRGSALPAFLYEHFIRVFHKDGTVRNEPVGIAELRLLLKMFYKFEGDLTPEMEADAAKHFVDVDASVKTHSYPAGLDRVRKHFTSLFPDNPMDIRAHHSNGATSVHTTNVEKRSVRHYLPNLMGKYGANYFFQNTRHASNWCAVNKTSSIHEEPRVTFVPKDSRKPRTICVYHHMYMFIQKGLQQKLYDFTESMSPARGYINFTDQSTNRRLAQKGSIDGGLATIDLRDASDLVPWELVKLLAPAEWFEALRATRTDFAMLPSGRVPLNKFAPMGSALCFPIEAFVFWAIAKTVAPEVWVYGDDIIVHTKYAQRVIAALESYGLLVNHDKTLTEGFFRESCGGHYYRGQDIGYTSCKSFDPEKYVAFCNQVAVDHSQQLAEDLLKDYENSFNEVFFREPLEYARHPEPYVFYTDRCASADVFFERRWFEDYQAFQRLRLHTVSGRAKKPKTHAMSKNMARKQRSNAAVKLDDDYLFDWLTARNGSSAPLEDESLEKILDGVFYPRVAGIISKDTDVLIAIRRLFPRGFTAARQDISPEAKYMWGLEKTRST